MRVCLIAAVAKDRVIGQNGQLPWHIPDELKYFKRITMGCPIIMGRKTFESIGKPLPGRLNIVLTRSADFSAEGVLKYSSLESALSTLDGRYAKVFVIGGGQVYESALEHAHEIYLTEVDKEVSGDTYFPSFTNRFKEISADPQESQFKDGSPVQINYKVYAREGQIV